MITQFLSSNNMSENPLQVLFQTFEKVSYSIQHHLSSFIGLHLQPASSGKAPPFSISSSSSHKSQSVKADSFVQPEDLLLKVKFATPVTKEELGRATWTFLHTLAAQIILQGKQKKDVNELMGILSRMYPCRECADHFKEVLRANPVQVGFHAEFSQWLCHVHNVVNRSLGKPIFPCERVDARWGKLECEKNACEVLGSTIFDDD